MGNIVKALESINTTLAGSDIKDIIITLISSLFGTFLGAILAFQYSNKIQRSQARFNYLIELKERIIENHFNIMTTLDDALRVRHNEKLSQNEKDELLMKFQRSHNINLAKIQILTTTISHVDPLFSELANYTDIFVKLNNVFFGAEFENSKNINEVMWNYDMDENGNYTKQRPVHEELTKYILKILELIGDETSKYINKHK